MNQYFYLDGQQKQYGPCSIDELRAAGITRGTKVWCAQMTDWDDAGNVPELRVLFEAPAAQPYGGQPYPPQGGQAYPPQSGPAYAPGAYPQGKPQPPGPKPDSWLAWSIVSVFLCCWALSIPAIVYASKVDSLWREGQYEEAFRCAKLARQWTIASAITGFVVYMAYGLLMAFGAISGFLD